MTVELERRREELRTRVASAAKENQAARAAALMGGTRRSAVAIGAALLVAFGIGATIGAIYLPTLQLYVQTCR